MKTTFKHEYFFFKLSFQPLKTYTISIAHFFIIQIFAFKAFFFCKFSILKLNIFKNFIIQFF